MLSAISQHLKQKVKFFFLTDNLIFKTKVVPILQEHFVKIEPKAEENGEKRIAFVDGGQAEIFSGGNVSLSFIRVFAQVFAGKEKKESVKHEFYVLTTASYIQGEIWYEATIFVVQGEQLVEESDLHISSMNASIREGNQRAPIGKVAGMARRFAELRLAAIVKADYVILDGTLEETLPQEEKYLSLLPDHVGAIAKTCTLFTTSGNNPVVLLQKLSPFQHCWRYFVSDKSYFVKLHPRAKHIFRFEGEAALLPELCLHSSDPLFLGYPYGLIFVDRMARVSNAEKNSLRMSLLLREENKELVQYLNTMNAHDILDNLG